MKLGKETGSVTNWMMSGTAGAPKPEVGMGATILCWSDRHAATIVKVTPTQVHVQRDKAARVLRPGEPGMSEQQEYTYEADPTAPVEIYRKTKRGWRSKDGTSLRIGKRDEYYDYSF